MKDYSKTYKKEMAFFIHPETGNVTYNEKCKECIHECKQSYKVEIIHCKHYQEKEFNLKCANNPTIINNLMKY